MYCPVLWLAGDHVYVKLFCSTGVILFCLPRPAAEVLFLLSCCQSCAQIRCVQNCLARVVLQDNCNSATSLLSELYRLPVNKQTEFKIATLTYQSLGFGQRTYLSLVFTPHQPQRSLCSVNQNLLSVPRCNSSFGQRNFSTVPLKSGMTHHFRSDSPLHSTALNAT